jgi:hypothetical protein
MSLDDLPKRIQYVLIDSNFVTGTNNTFTVDLTLKSNTHIENINKVIGLKMVDFYITQVGDHSTTTNSDIAKFVDIICPEIPKVAQILDERRGQIFARVPLERHFAGTSDNVVRDKQWKSFARPTSLFNPISIKQLSFELYEYQSDNDYRLLQPDATWHMILEVTTIDVKEKPKDKNVQLLQILDKLCSKVDKLNENVQKLPDKEDLKKPKKYSFGTLVFILMLIVGGFIWWVNRPVPRGPPQF